MSLQNPPPTVANQLFSGQYTTIHRAEFNNVGHDLVRNFYTTIANPHKTLWDAIAGVGASHNSALQSSRGSCLSGTREGVLRDIHEWRSSENTSSPVCWLSGPTGVGKSAIALTVAKSCAKSGKLAASFFFLRSDPKRNNPSFLMLTIAHGLLTTKPSLRRIIDRKITDDPSILEATLEDQFAELIARPLLRRRWWSWKHVQQLLLSRSSQKCPYFVIIDGIDECSDSDTQLRVISLLMSAYQQSPHFPLRLLICSRSESWIREVFDVPNINIFVKHIMLDESYLPSKDIERYFLHEFSGIRTSARYSQVIFPESWPSSADIQRLVQNASGQFIYAITVMKFVKAEYSHPIAQLRIILDNSPNQIRESPFVELDNLYHIIVSANPDHEKLLCILSAILLLPGYGPSSPEFIELLLGLSAGEVDLSLRGMHSVLAIHGRGHKIEVYHTSFIDYLHDRSRSSEFFISKAQQRDFLASQWLATLSKHCKLPAKSMKSFHGFNPSIGVLYQNWADFCCSVEQPSKQLLDNLKSLNIFHLLIVASNNPFFWTELPTNAPEPRIHWPCFPLKT
ncbi:hypothetical protein L218DRAFT_950448 [Marasmius fiardii PR-910]|nr:hypothetical protein L218DRAFT_950448 [Marasmius fiardii PR-910]